MQVLHTEQTPLQPQNPHSLKGKQSSTTFSTHLLATPATRDISSACGNLDTTQPTAMCEKGILIWTCGCTHLQDPRFCRKAIFRKKPCDGYGFSWAYRSPIPWHTLKKCPSCLHAEEVRKAQLANEALLATSSAYPTLQSVANGDDSRREGRGRPRFDRVASGGEICVPEGWRPEMNRLPGNANEYSAWLGGRFDPLVRLEDTHQPSSRVARPQSSLPARAARAQEIPAQQVQHRVRLHAPPQCWNGPVVLEENAYPFVEFRCASGQRPGQSRRPSYTGRVLDKGWAPPSSGTLPPQRDVDTAPPSQVPSPHLKVSPSRLRITQSKWF
ncbi:hypothetical protein AUEXF2481DRAFT_216829 [Aureobasidium subglaciale EXF-2481]|uniref:Uncharacterized protein n=1 Tax=Aureobasidium subglaciale (strain EXF-2481) TaxID=1043005 RepID=A0A074Z949_AURSE|nr:uncharacterized protein AUEXF2481DRAFT_216829 [Aureobasidium subglaciale EXF-2481]KEQ95356.1 hypothetical protein AUEXF2481DRAFT_216829 [Aureobasidium subglaciale EXF-2481]